MNIMRWERWREGMHHEPEGPYVMYDDHRAVLRHAVNEAVFRERSRITMIEQALSDDFMQDGHVKGCVQLGVYPPNPHCSPRCKNLRFALGRSECEMCWGSQVEKHRCGMSANVGYCDCNPEPCSGCVNQELE